MTNAAVSELTDLIVGGSARSRVKPKTSDGPREATPAPPPWADRVLDVESRWFTQAPARRTWLLRDHRTSEGVLPLGKVGQLVAEGGGGKTMALVQLVVAVPNGGRWLGALDVASPGRVLAILGEEDFEETQRRIFYAARAGKVAAPADGMIVTMPLAGLPSEMVCRDPDGNPTDAPFLRWLREYLRAHNDWRLIVIDPLSRFAGLDAEKDNAQATRFIEALESIAVQTGATVLVAHHSNQSSRGGGRVGATASRGVTALVDGVRWAATMGVEQVEGLDPIARERLGELVTVSFVKSNYSRKGAGLLAPNQAATTPDLGGTPTSLGAGLLAPWAGRMDWATLLQRVYLHDVLACPCGGRRTIVADIHDPDAIRDVLHDLGLPTEAPPIARARDPSYDAA